MQRNSSAMKDVMEPLPSEARNDATHYEFVDVESIQTDVRLQPRTGLRSIFNLRMEAVIGIRNHIKRQREARCPHELGALHVARLGSTLFLVDGHHRRMALLCERVRRTWIKIVLDAKDDSHEGAEAAIRQAQHLAYTANLGHGTPLTGRDHRAAFKRFVENGLNVVSDEQGATRLMSYREIASAFNQVKTHRTFMNWMQVEFPEVAAKMSRDDSPEETEKGLFDVGIKLQRNVEDSLDVFFSRLAALNRRDPDEAKEVEMRLLRRIATKYGLKVGDDAEGSDDQDCLGRGQEVEGDY